MSNPFKLPQRLLLTSIFGGLITVATAQTTMPLKWQFTPSSGHTTVALSQDGSFIATPNGSGVCLYSAAAQLPTRIINPIEGTPVRIVFSPDNKTLALQTSLPSKMDRLELWDAAAGKFLGALPAHLNSINSLAFSHDGRMLAIGGTNRNATTQAYTGVLEQWSVAGRYRISELKTRATAVFSVAYSVDGKYLAEGGFIGKGSSLEVWNAKTGHLFKDLTPPDLAGVWTVLFTPDGKTFAATGSSTKADTLDKWELSNWKMSTIQACGPPSGSGLILSPDATQYLQFQIQTQTKLGQPWQSTSASLYAFSNPGVSLHNYSLGWQCYAVAFSADSSTVAMVGDDYSWYGTGQWEAYEPSYAYLTLSNLNNDTPDSNLTLGEYSVWSGVGAYLKPVFSPSGKYVFGGGANYGASHGLFSVWNARDGSVAATLDTESIIGPQCAAFSADEKTLFIGNGGNPTSVQLWDMDCFALAKTLSTNLDVTAIAISPRASLIAVGGTPAFGNDQIQIWNYSTGKLVETLTTSANFDIVELVYSKDGKSLAVAASRVPTAYPIVRHGVLELWNLKTGGLPYEFPTQESFVNGVTFTPDGKSLIAIGPGKAGFGEVWSVETGKLSKTLTTSRGFGTPSSTVFSRDGKRLYAMTPGDSADVEIFDARTYKSLGFHTASVGYASYPALALSEDATMLAATSQLLGIQVFKVPTLTCPPVTGFEFNPAPVFGGGAPERSR